MDVSVYRLVIVTNCWPTIESKLTRRKRILFMPGRNRVTTKLGILVPKILVLKLKLVPWKKKFVIKRKPLQGDPPPPPVIGRPPVTLVSRVSTAKLFVR